MVNANFLRRILVVGEKGVLTQMSQYVPLAKDAATKIMEMLTAEDAARNKLNDEIRALERKADDLSVSMKDQITSGAISSTLMDNLVKLVEKFDDLLDGSYYISREIKRIKRNNHKFDDFTLDVLRNGYSSSAQILKISLDALDHVKAIVECTEFKEMKREREQIEALEERVDDIKDNLLDYLYNNSDSIPYIVFIHLTGLVHRLDDLLDDCEDISDLIHTITVAVTR
ncbi:MAG TPA: DUF47 family protein [Thermoplasmataceae archaeon]|nr:DUF47 family protein [Thermoplasmatales archaeon AK]HLH86569.1 DUF47 family protein [Thermoplasmataceae archaeon]